MNKKALIPSGISALRLAALPLFFYLYNLSNIAACLALLVFCAATDYFDGYYARKLNVASKFGAYFDATTDFTLMIGIFAFFTFEGFYSHRAGARHSSRLHPIHNHKRSTPKNSMTQSANTLAAPSTSASS